MTSGAFRKKRVYFAQVSNSALRDSTLSLKAKGLYALIQSYITIEGFTLYKNTLIKACKESKTAFESTWKELKDQGYLKQYKIQAENGTFYYEYELLDEKQVIQSDKIMPIHTHKTQGVDNPLSGEPGAYNKSDLKNTDFNNTDTLLHQAKPDDFYACSELHHSAAQPDVASISTKVTKRKDDGYYDIKAIKNGYFSPEMLPYIDCYLDAQASYRRPDGSTLHIKKISKQSLEHVYGEVSDLIGDGIDIEDWKEAVQEHFENLPRRNDGDILAFLEASRRYFG